MVYVALLPIGGYKVGDVVPDDKALAWLKSYAVPQVGLRGAKAPEPKALVEEEAPVEEPDKVAPKEETPEVEPDVDSPLLDNYLDQNQRTVIKALEGDELSEDELKSLLEMEEAGKGRKGVLGALKSKLG